MKDNKVSKIQFRVNEEDYYFFQNLKENGINLSKYMLTLVRNDIHYKKYHNLIHG